MLGWLPTYNELKTIIDCQPVEQVLQFRHLGSLMSGDRYCEHVIQSRVLLIAINRLNVAMYGYCCVQVDCIDSSVHLIGSRDCYK